MTQRATPAPFTLSNAYVGRDGFLTVYVNRVKYRTVLPVSDAEWLLADRWIQTTYRIYKAIHSRNAEFRKIYDYIVKLNGGKSLVPVSSTPEESPHGHPDPRHQAQSPHPLHQGGGG